MISTGTVEYGQISSAKIDEVDFKDKLKNLNTSYFLVSHNNTFELIDTSSNKANNYSKIAIIPAINPRFLGNTQFQHTYQCKYSHYAGAMANGIASERMLIELGKNHLLGSFGSGGLLPSQIESAITIIKNEVPSGAFIFNLLYNPKEPSIEKETVNLYLKYGINNIEAAAYMIITPYLVYFRVKGLKKNSENKIEINNRIIAKISRKEMAEKFLSPAPLKILSELYSEQLITEEQFNMAQKVPMADDITVEADSGGHTDNRTLVVIFPTITFLRDQITKQHKYETNVRIGAAGGISTPHAALAAFAMGADYIVTGTVNQACIESGASAHTKLLLSQASDTDVAMAPAADMFEQGVKLQVLKKGTFFPMRAQKLYTLYSSYNSIDEIPMKEKDILEQQYFKNSLENIWRDTASYFNKIDPAIIDQAEKNPKKKMSLIFRWYLGLSSRWSNSGEQGREMDYQIWCGPSIGSFNEWVKESYLENINNRQVVDVNEHIINGAAYLFRLQNVKYAGITLPCSIYNYFPETLK